MKLPDYNYGIIYFGVGYIYLGARIYIYIYKSAGSIFTHATSLLIRSREQGGLGCASLAASMLWVEYNIFFYLI